LSQIRFVLLLSRQGKVRLAKWYTTLSQKERAKIMKEVTPIVLSRAPKLCNFVDWRDAKIVYRRYASLYFVAGIDAGTQRTLPGCVAARPALLTSWSCPLCLPAPFATPFQMTTS
jgi:hypothetical protein